jgi:hypothetical protein
MHPAMLITSSWPKCFPISNSTTCSNTDIIRTPLHLLIEKGGLLSFHTGLDLFELYRLLLNAGADEILIDNVDVFRGYRGPVGNLKYLQQQAYPPYHRAPMRLRLDVAAPQLATAWHNMPAVLETLLDNNGKINAEITEWTNEKEQTLLHLVLGAFAYVQIHLCLDFEGFPNNYLDGSLEKQDLETVSDTSNVHSLLCRHFICKLISAGAPLQSIDSDGHTLLTGMIYGFLDWNFTNLSNWTVGRTLKALNKHLVDWLFTLLECGVDLQDYGAWETISSQNKDFRHFWYYSPRLGNTGNEKSDLYRPSRYSAAFNIRLLGITYGPRPEDWIFWFSEPSDPFTGDFWAMVEGEEHWRVAEKGWFFDTKCDSWGTHGWYFDEEEKDPNEEGASIDDLPMPGSWSEES